MSEKNKKLNPEQSKAVTHTDGPLLIVAGAGTGKTTVLIERLNYLITEKLAKPDEVLITTFTEKAASEMEERADRLLPMGYVDLWINTFHGFCERILRDHALDIGLANDFKLLTQTEQWLLVRKNLDKFELDYYRPLGNATKFIHELLRHFSRLKDENISAAEYLEYAEKLKIDADSTNDGEELEIKRIVELAQAYNRYNRFLLAENYLDFGDLINYTIKLFKERPNILKFYRAKFKYIMVDEFQDTNWSQYELIKLLASPKDNLAVVGDDDQAIYKFRGASLSNIMQFKDDYKNAREVILNDNYRSGQRILDHAYEFITKNNPNRLEVKLGINKKLTAHRKEGSEAEHIRFETEEQETFGIVKKIAEIYEKEKDTQWSDFVILVRANDTADKFVAELTRHNIPNQFVSLRGLYYKPVILDIIAYLKLLDNYHESVALFRVLNMEIFKVRHEDIININKFARRKVWSVFETLEKISLVPDVSPEGVANIAKLLLLIKKHSLLAPRERSSKIYLEFINESGFNRSLDYDKDAPMFDILNQFYQRIKKFEQAIPHARLKDFLEMLAMEFESGETGSLALSFEDAETVKIMTVHAAKGLEFKYVFVPALVDKKFPVVSRTEKISIPDELVREKLPEGDTHIEEERRLFYVAVTRAKDGLFLTSASDYGGARDKKPSRFISEAGFGEEENKLTIKPKKNKKRENGLIKDLEALKQKEAPAPAIKYKLPDKFSFSQLEAYANCPLQYKFNFILKIPVEDKVSFIFGRVMHNTLRDALSPVLLAGTIQPDLFNGQEKIKHPTLEEVYGFYEKNWQDDGFHNKKEREEYKKKGREILGEFYAQLEHAGWPAVMFLEKNFNLKIGGYILKGSIDRLDRLSDGGLEIIDYKTGKPKDKLTFEDKRQLMLYQIAAEEAFGLKVKKLSYYYLENGQFISFEAKEKDIEKVKEQIIEGIGEIVKCNFIPNPGFLCSYCDFNNICEFRK